MTAKSGVSEERTETSTGDGDVMCERKETSAGDVTEA